MDSINMRLATENDLKSIITLVANDDVIGKREGYNGGELDKVYFEAFENIKKDPNNEVVVAEKDNKVLGTLQITYIPYLSNKGRWRALFETVMVSNEVTGMGIGGKMMKWSIERAKERNCCLIQLTTNKQRPAAFRFYEKLGFTASHEGMKLEL